MVVADACHCGNLTKCGRTGVLLLNYGAVTEAVGGAKGVHTLGMQQSTAYVAVYSDFR